MEAHLSALIAFLAAHPHAALAVVFGAALLESLALIGTVIPGSSVVFIGGALVGLDALDPWWTAAAAVVGAILGDGISYWLGQHYRDRIGGVWPFDRFPQLLRQGQDYFSRHGGKSIFFGRFLPPVRAIVPVAAGMAAMPPARFLAVNVLSALAWATAHLIPGLLFGASLQLAGAVSARLVFLLLLLAAFFWGVTHLVRLAVRYGWPGLQLLRARALRHARDRRGAWAAIVRLLFDPASAAEAAMLGAALLLAASVWAFFGVLEEVLTQGTLVQLDQGIHAALQALRTEWGDALMLAVTAFGAVSVLAPVAAVVALALGWRRDWRGLGHWLVVVGAAELTVAGLKGVLTRARPYNPLYTGAEQFSFPSGHTTMSLVVYGCLALLLARGRPPAVRTALALAAACAVALIAFSRLYLGVHWFSDVLASLSLGLAWVMLFGLLHGRGARHRQYQHQHRRQHLPALALLATVLAAGGWHAARHHDAEMARYRKPPPSQTVLADWQAGGWRLLPPARSELDGQFEEPFVVQWAAPRARIAAALAAAGWQAAPPWTAASALLWLLPGPAIQQLPVLPKFDHGSAAQATFVKVLDPGRRAVLRLWPTPYAIPGAAGYPVHTVWQGIASIEHLHHPAGLVSVVKTTADFTLVLAILKQELQAQGWSAADRQGSGGAVLLIWQAPSAPARPGAPPPA